MKNNKYFKVTRLYHKAMVAMSDKQAGEFIKALSTYVFTEETPKVIDPFVYGLLLFAKKDIDTAMKNRENGRLGALALARKKQGQQDEAICDCPVDCILMEEMFEDLIKEIKNHLQTAAQPDGESMKTRDTPKQDKESGKTHFRTAPLRSRGQAGNPLSEGAKKERKS